MTIPDQSKVLEVLDLFAERVSPDLTLRQVRMFLFVMENEGTEMYPLDQVLQCAQSAVSKNARNLMKQFDLLRLEEGTEDARRKRLFLTNKGHLLADKIKSVLKS